MNTKIEIKDLNVHDVVRDFAEELGISYSSDNNEICLDIPNSLGTGFIKAVSFDSGLGTLEMDFRLEKEVRLEMNDSKVQPLKIIFNRESTITHAFDGKGEKHLIKQLESAILSGNNKHENILILPAGKPICLFSLEINRKLFENKIEEFLGEMNDELEALFRDVNGVNLFYYSGYYTLDIAKCIEQSIECELTDFTRSVFLEGKAYEILAHHLRQYIDDLTDPEKRKILRQTTVKKLKEAATIIETELENMDNIIALSKRVGLNQNTLQGGFKSLYNSSVNEYIRNARIEKAKKLIENTNLNITEITYQIGINSRSYFSKLFKERYSISPKQYVNQVRNKPGTKSA